ncbi:MAG: bifunctional hydroxymethylpyrimidine kinase/phosphomethylpyrimidine kinase [Promethearchaeota archaeon]
MDKIHNICLTIAGADPTSGAGIQADIRTFDRCGVHPFSIVTALTYQTATDFFGYTSLSDHLEDQLKSIFEHYAIKYVKIGMIPDLNSLEIILKYIKMFDLSVIYDPITISSTGERLSNEGIEKNLEKELFPVVKILTPNISEALFYSGMKTNDLSLKNIIVIKKVANLILEKLYRNSNHYEVEKAVIIKNAITTKDKVIDLALINKDTEKGLEKVYRTYEKRKLEFQGNVHGTGCIFSSAITAFLCQGNSLETAIKMAEVFFDEKFQKFIELPKNGKLIDLTLTEDKLDVINQIKEIYSYVSTIKKFSVLIPEVRLNISGSLPNAQSKNEIAGIEGRVTIINGYPHASGQIKFGVSDHTARLILAAKEFDKSINFATNLKYDEKIIKLIQEKTDLFTYEFIRESQPDIVKLKEHSTMQWLIKESIENTGKIPDIVWDKGAIGKEPIMRIFAKDSHDMISKLDKIIKVI